MDGKRDSRQAKETELPQKRQMQDASAATITAQASAAHPVVTVASTGAKRGASTMHTARHNTTGNVTNGRELFDATRRHTRAVNARRHVRA